MKAMRFQLAEDLIFFFFLKQPQSLLFSTVISAYFIGTPSPSLSSFWLLFLPAL